MLDSNEYGNNNDLEDDPDDDLRSLLSGGSAVRPTINPHRVQQQQQQQQQLENNSNSRAAGGGGGSHTQESSNIGLLMQSSNNSSEDNSSNMNRGNRSTSPPSSSLNIPPYNNNNSNSGSSATCCAATTTTNNASSTKKALYLLGTIILVMACIGPSGLLWDVFEMDNTSNDNNILYSHHHHGSSVHGDKHHNLPPPPPSSSSSYNNNNNNQMAASYHGMNIEHPMIRREEYTATNSRHDKFGIKTEKRLEKTTAINRRKKNNIHNSNGGEGGGGGWGIKEAIENIDKVFLDNRPQHKVVKKKKKKKKQQQGQDGVEGTTTTDDDALSSSLGTDDEELGHEEYRIPIVHADDDTLPENAEALDTYEYNLPASDALECRASVIAFVINATDVRDECDGLRKAFDKTCSVSSIGGGGTAAMATSADSSSGGKVRRHEQQSSRTKRRRRLSEWGQPQIRKLFPTNGGLLEMKNEWGQPMLLNLIPEAFRRTTTRRRLTGEGDGYNIRHVNRTLQGEVGSSEGGNMKHQRKMEEEEIVERDEDDEVNTEDEEEGEIEQKPAVQQQQQQQKQEVVSPLISLNIPTADKHISETMLNDALLLQDAAVGDTKTNLQSSANSLDNVQQSPPSSLVHDQGNAAEKTFDVNGPPNSHNDLPSLSSGQQQDAETPVVVPNSNLTAAAAEAVQDAAESAGAIRTAVEGVKNIMNDPKSIEARTCCASILSVFHEHCDPTTTGVEDYSDRRLLVVVFVITVCGMVKSVIRHLNIRWLPEAGGCILVGVFGYLILQHMPHVQFAFDGDMFLRIMVPPIVFEAAVKINKQSFRRHVVPIVIFAIVGTLASTVFTAFILYKGSSMSHYVTTIPVRESLIFGALISSIDPIAVLSVLNNMGMSDTDTIYVLIFGESLLNDGVAIVLFQTLVHFLDESLVIDSDVVMDAFMHFVVVALGSVIVGMASGACATVYFALMHGCQTPMVEVIMFCCWSFIPYYICDMVEWSGIVAIVANGFVMDLYVIGQKHQQHNSSSAVDDEIDFLVNGTNGNGRTRHYRQQQCRSIFGYEGHLSSKADSHVHFVIEIFATLMETAIFAYLGLFLFSPRYHWSGYLTIISIFATVMGRIIMIPLFSHIANIFNRMGTSRRNSNGVSNNYEGVHIDKRMQLVLVFAGLRGAMSFALVEHIPMFDTTTGQGSRLKPELKAMTSASVIFTVFVLGGATSYLMERLGYSINKQQQHDSVEIIPLVQHHEKRKSNSSPATKSRNNNGVFSLNDSSRSTGSSVRQRGPR